MKTRISNKFFLKLCAVSGNMFNKLLFRASKAPTFNGLAINHVSSFDERINEFWISVSNQFPIMVVRSKDYLNWRYTTVPDISYSIYLAEKAGAVCGYLILRCLQREYIKVAAIYDLLAESEAVVQCLLSKATEQCRMDGVDYIYWSSITNKAYLRAFRKRGFISQPFQKSVSKFIVASTTPDIPKEFLSNQQNWFIQIGDLDIL